MPGEFVSARFTTLDKIENLHTYFAIDTKICGTLGTSIWRQPTETVVSPNWSNSPDLRAIAERSDYLIRISMSGLGGPTRERVDISL